MRFWDSSAIIPLLIRQGQTAYSKKLLAEDQEMIVSRATMLECYSALARLGRENKLINTELAAAQKALKEYSEFWKTIGTTDKLYDIAKDLPYQHGLTAADALQLASALVWARKTPRDKFFICFDLRLANAAKSCGFNVLSF